ncbi:MAG: GMP synthase (glutamine-hydrolyzing) [Parasphingorhabdus sp.]
MDLAANPAQGQEILLIYHGSQRADRVSRMLIAQGYRLRWVNPVIGEKLPDSLDDLFAVVVYGGAHSVNDKSADVISEQAWISRWIAAERPYLGLCLGSQFLARALGTEVQHAPDVVLENGYTRIDPVEETAYLSHPLYVFEWHNEGYELPKDCTLFAKGLRFPTQGYYYKPWIVGLQFHPEVVPEVAIDWFEEAGYQQNLYGAHSVERQFRDAQVFEKSMEKWTGNLLEEWLKAAHQNSNQLSKGAMHV